MDAVLALIAKRKDIGRLFPGLAIALAIAVIVTLLRRAPALAMVSPLMLAILVGIVIGNVVRLPAQFQPGLGFSSRRVLRFAIALLGFQLSASQIAVIGFDGVAIVACAVVITFLGMGWMGTLLGVDAKLAGLLAAGTSICGASAVAAMSTVNRASEEDVSYAMGAVTVLGTVLMFLLPVVAHWLGLDAQAFGLWAGASIHEVAQVTGAAFQFSNAAGEAGVVVKLLRVLMLAPLILICGLWARRRMSVGAEGVAAPGFPVFVLGFIAAVALNSLVSIPPDARANLMLATTFLMSVALAALGLQTNVGKLRAKGMRPLALGALGTVLIVGITLGMIVAAGWFA
jgi:uncharacterized integral membrane protein (TIGR00698 family)